MIARSYFGCVVLKDGSVLVTGGQLKSHDWNSEAWKSSDGGVNWTLLTNAALGENTYTLCAAFIHPIDSIIFFLIRLRR